MQTRPFKFTKKELEKKINEYFDLCEDKKKFPTFAGLARYIGVSRQSVWKWDGHERFGNLIGMARNRIIDAIEDKLMNDTKNVAGVIFLAKNYGYSDRIVNESEIGGEFHKLLMETLGSNNDK
jgi:hypothetical protein